MEFSMKCKAFATEGVRINLVSVDSDGTVRVYDAVARHYTTFHSLSLRAQQRARKIAAAA